MSGNSVLKPDLTIFLTYIKLREKNDSNWLRFYEYTKKRKETSFIVCDSWVIYCDIPQ